MPGANFQALIASVASSSAPVTTWNSADKASTVTLSNGDLDATGNSSTWGTVRATHGKSSGKHYWEVKISALTAAGWNAWGIVRSDFSLTANPSTTGPCCIDRGATNWVNGGPTDNWTGTPTNDALNDVYMFALDMDNGRYYSGENGTWHNSGDPAAGTGYVASGLTGTWYAAVATFNSNNTMRGQFSAVQCTYSPPSGFSNYGG